MTAPDPGTDATPAPLARYGALVAGLTLLAFTLRLAAGLAQHAMVPEYAAYYATAAEELARGHGLTVPYAWSYLVPAVSNGLALPRPAFDVWLPGASLVAAPFVPWLGGDTASRLAGALAGAALVPLVASLGRRAAPAMGEAPRVADRLSLVAAGLVAVSLPLVTGSISSDSQALFGVTTLAGVLAVERAVERGRGRDLLLAGLVLGAGLWVRNEAIFVLAAAALIVARAGDAPPESRTRAPAPGGRVRALARSALLVLVAAATYAPWAVRQWLVFGSPMPSGAAANALSASPLDIFGWAAPRPTLGEYLALGPGQLLDQRVTAVWHNLVEVLLFPALPWSLVGIAGIVLLWRARPLRLLIAVTVAILAADTLVFPVATLFGTFLHGSAPVMALLAIGAASAAIRGAAWLGRTRIAAGPWLGGAVVRAIPAAIGVVTLAGVLITTASGSTGYAAWANDVPVRYGALARGLAEAGLGDAVVIASHPSWAWRVAGHPAVTLPAEDGASILSLARAYGATVVAVDGQDGGWPAAASTTPCLVPIPLPADAGALTAFRVACTGP